MPELKQFVTVLPPIRAEKDRYIRILHYKCGCPLIVARYEKAITEDGLTFTLHADAICTKHGELIVLPES